MRDPAAQRGFPAPDGVLTTDFASIRDDPEIELVAEVMGGVEPTREATCSTSSRPASRS